MAKQLTFSEEARAAMKRGIDTMANTVGVTLGPRGRNVVLDKKFGPPQVCSDGVTIAKEIELEDPFENMGAQLLKEAASKTNDVAGDGTTTATVLAQAIIHEGFKNIAAGANPMAIKRGIDKAVDTLRSSVQDMSTPVEGRTQIGQVAALSAHDDEMGLDRRCGQPRAHGEPNPGFGVDGDLASEVRQPGGQLRREPVGPSGRLAVIRVSIRLIADVQMDEIESVVIAAHRRRRGRSARSLVSGEVCGAGESCSDVRFDTE